MIESREEQIIVSVWMIAFNHEQYIGKAIQSVLDQKINFRIELVIGDDCSKDDTVNIAKEYASKYPNIIKLRSNPKNLGMMENMILTLRECRGKYIALLEADDYWIDNEKLQRQVNMLETDLTLSMVFHNAMVKYENIDKEPHKFGMLEDRLYEPEEIIRTWTIPTASVVLRNFEFNFPDFALDCAHGDILLFLMVMETGRTKAISECLSVYRKNEQSVTLNNALNADYINKIINQLKSMNIYFNHRYNNELKAQIKYWYLALLSSHFLRKEYFSYFCGILKFTYHHPKGFFKHIGNKLIGKFN